MSDRSLPAAATGHLGFLAVVSDAGGWLGGYLVTNSWGRPVEFRLSTAVQPNRVQHALYGPTLAEYLHADLIGKTLVEKTPTKPDLVVVNTPPALALRGRIDVPVVGLKLADAGAESQAAGGLVTFTHPRASVPLLLAARFAADEAAVRGLLDALDPALDLAEPFARILAAVAEHRRSGGAARAA